MVELDYAADMNFPFCFPYGTCLYVLGYNYNKICSYYAVKLQFFKKELILLLFYLDYSFVIYLSLLLFYLNYTPFMPSLSG